MSFLFFPHFAQLIMPFQYLLVVEKKSFSLTYVGVSARNIAVPSIPRHGIKEQMPSIARHLHP